MAKLKQKGKGGSDKVEKNKTHSGNFKSKKTNNISKKNFTQKKRGAAKKRKEKPGNKEKELHEDIKVDNTEIKSTKRKLPINKESIDTKKTKKSESLDGTNRLMAIYELLRQKNTSKDDKHKLVEEVLKYVTNKENEVVFKHDTVRVLEHCMKYGSNKQRGHLFDLFKDNTILLVTSAGYSKFLVKKFMEYGTKEQKAKIISSFHGKVRKLIKHKTAADILEELYAKYANSVQRTALTGEFYGPEFAVFKVATGQTFEDLIENEPAKRESVMDYMKSEFITLCQKDMILHSITHKALLDFFKYANDLQKLEVHNILKERVIHILHTKDGSKVAMNCLWLGTPKDRKAILKSFKTFVVKICKEEFGHLVMLALFDVVDDTVLVKKALFPEILSNLADLIGNQYGRKVILYLLKPRSHSYFLPDIIKILEQGDNNTHSKKSMTVRQDELRTCILPELLKAMASHANDIMSNKSVAIVLLAAIDCSKDSPELINLFEKIAGVISKPIKTIETEVNIPVELDVGTKATATDVGHPVCDACGHWVIKSIIQKDKARSKDGNKVIFSKIVCDLMSIGSFVDWATFNRGAFILVSLLETEIDSVRKRVEEDLNLLPEITRSQSIGNSKGFELLQNLINK